MKRLFSYFNIESGIRAVERSVKVLSFFFILFSLSCAHLDLSKKTQNVILSGLTKHNKSPLPNAKVNIYDIYSMSFVKSATADEKGYFSVELPEGGYYVLGSKEGNTENYFAYLGNNPAYLSGFSGELSIVLDYIKIPPNNCCNYKTDTTALESIAGTVMFKNKPVENAQVYFFGKFFSEIRLKGRGARIETTDDSGSFLAELNPDKYFIIVRKRFSGQMAGPLKEGDLFGYFHKNPLKLHPGEKHVIKIFTDKKQKDNIKSKTYITSHNGIVPLNETVVSGKVYDINNKPVKGMYVFLSDTQELAERPAYFSKPTKEDGSYEIHLGTGGSFFIAAKEKLGEVIKPGTQFGSYDGSVDRHLGIKKGSKLKNINLTVEKIQ